MLHKHVYLQLLLSMVTLPLSATNYHWDRRTTPHVSQGTEAQKNFEEILGYIYPETQIYIDVTNLANGTTEQKIIPQHTFNQACFDALCQNLSTKLHVTEQKTWLKQLLAYCAKNSSSYIPDDMLYIDYLDFPTKLASNIAEQFKQHTTLLSKITEKNVETSYSNLAAKNMDEKEQEEYYKSFIFDLAHCGLIPITQKLFSEKRRTKDLQLQQAIAQQIQIAKLIQIFLNEEDFDTKTIDYFSNKSKTQYNLNLSEETISYIYNIFKNMRDSANKLKWGSNTFLNTYKNLYNQANFLHDLSRLACKTSFCPPENKLNAQKIWLEEEEKITETILDGSIDEMEKFLCGYSFSAEYSQYEGDQKARITVAYLKKAMELSCWQDISSHVYNVISAMLSRTQDHYSNALLLFQKILTAIKKQRMPQTYLTDLNKSFVQNLKLIQEKDERKTHDPNRRQITYPAQTYQTPVSVDLVKQYKPTNTLSELQKTMESNLAHNNSANIDNIIKTTLERLENILKNESITATVKIATLQQTERIIPVTKRVPLAMMLEMSPEFVAQLASFEGLDFNTWMRGEIAIQLLPFLFNPNNNKYAIPIMFVSYLSTCVQNGCPSCEDTLPHFLLFLKTVKEIIQNKSPDNQMIDLICKTFKEFNSIIRQIYSSPQTPSEKATEALNTMLRDMTTPLKREEYFALVPTGGLINTATDLTKNINKLNNNDAVKKTKNLIRETKNKQTVDTLDDEQKPIILLQEIEKKYKDFYTLFFENKNLGTLIYQEGANRLMYH